MFRSLALHLGIGAFAVCLFPGALAGLVGLDREAALFLGVAFVGLGAAVIAKLWPRPRTAGDIVRERRTRAWGEGE